MTPYEAALARRRAYTLFGLLFLEGINESLLDTLAAVPELVELALPFDADEAAAAHYQLTSVAVFPYESIFRDPSGLLGGEISEQLAAAYRRHGFVVDSDADHLGQELLYLAHLCLAEGDAFARGDESAASLWQSRQQAFLVTHLLAWFAPFALAVAAARQPFYERLSLLTLALAADHLNTYPQDAPLALSPAPPLGDGESGLKDIARFLATPPHSGLFVSRDTISAIARGQQLPRGFGDRTQMLTNLLRTGGQYDAAGDTFLALADHFASAAGSYAALRKQFPPLAAWVLPWQDRAGQTAATLRDLANQLQTAQAST